LSSINGSQGIGIVEGLGMEIVGTFGHLEYFLTIRYVHLRAIWNILWLFGIFKAI
jgi:hypothetical protein